MENFNLDTPLIIFDAYDPKSAFTIRSSLEHLFIAGQTGAGKTSSTGRLFSQKYLLHGYGGLVLVSKPQERDLWIEYCKETGRLDDLIIIGPNAKPKHRFNFLEYISQEAEDSKAITTNIVEVMTTVIRSGQNTTTGNGGDEAFWRESQAMTLGYLVDLSLLAYGKVTVEALFNILQSLPQANGIIKTLNTDNHFSTLTAFEKAFYLARQNGQKQIIEWQKNVPADRKAALSNKATLDKELEDALPDVRLLNHLTDYFLNSFKNLSQRTRGIIEYLLIGFLYKLMREPIYSLFSNGPSTVQPEDTYDGKILLIDLPLKKYHETGHTAQMMFKYIWQRAVEKRPVKGNTRPLFLWGDEGHLFLHEHDQEFLTTCRSSFISVVLLSQNLPNFYAAMGGHKPEYKVQSLMGNIGTKIFHCNSCIETNNWASEMIGNEDFTDPSASTTVSNDTFSKSENIGIKEQPAVKPAEFTRLATGGPLNDYKCETIIYRSGVPFNDLRNFKRVTFSQINPIVKH